MKEELIKLLDKAYAPYSKFHVSCIVEMKDGKFIPGVNVENASYGATICAERNVFTTAIAYGYKPKDFEKLYIMTKGDISTPCFICRQFITEFFEYFFVLFNLFYAFLVLAFPPKMVYSDFRLKNKILVRKARYYFYERKSYFSVLRWS